jgi:hypothetical protein
MLDNLKVYGRIEDDRIIEYPVYALHIENRGHPYDFYTPCLFGVKPTVDEFSYLEEHRSISIDRQSIHVTYTVNAYDLNQLLARLPAEKTDELNLPTLISPTQNPQPSPELINKIKELIPNQIENDLNIFAATRGYSNFKSACDFGNSEVPKYAAEGKYCRNLRDSTWLAFEVYMAAVESGEKTISSDWNSIKKEWPTPIWPGESVSS